MTDEAKLQQDYYRNTAHNYDDTHLQQDPEQAFALSFFASCVKHFDFRTALDVGAGTGRVFRFMSDEIPEVRVIGVEPVRELREVGHSNGIAPESLVEGDATKLLYPDNSFDVVCSFAVLHHVKEPHVVVGEMLRVARKAIFISDANNFGQGARPARLMKQTLRTLGLWRVYDLMRTRGKGYHVSEGDGVFYSYSLFDNYEQIRKACHSVHLLNTTAAHTNPYRSAAHVALLGLKDETK